MESVLPKIKKKISSYINSETGRITKQSIITIGAFIGTAALATLTTTKTAKAGLTAELNPTEGEKINVTGKHVSHASHSQNCGQGCGESCGERDCQRACELACQGQGCGSGQNPPPPCGEPTCPSAQSPCTATCEITAQPGGCGSYCEGHCQSTCQVSCMYDCETNCQQCQTTCETTCEHVNQNCCQAGCESGVPGLER